MLQPLDACYALEVMNDSHTQQLLPRVEQPHTEWEAFAGHCVDCKVGLGTAAGVGFSCFMQKAIGPWLEALDGNSQVFKGLSLVCYRTLPPQPSTQAA